MRQLTGRLDIMQKICDNIAAMDNYRKRVSDQILAFKLESAGAVLVEGVKWCGKTTTSEQIAKSCVYLDEIRDKVGNLDLLKVNIAMVLDGERPHLIDEWQFAPFLWDSVRHHVDHAKEMGCFILTGSSVPADQSEIFHSGTGRFAWVKMRPMSLWESGESSGSVSLEKLFAGGEFPVAASHGMTLADVAFATCRGGWPQSIGLSRRAALQQAYNYVDALVERDISRVDGTLRDPDRARRLLKSYARLQGTQATASVMRADLVANADGDHIREDTIYSYLSALRKLFAIEDSKAWCANLRCKTPIRTTDTRYFVDPSIAVAALELGPEDLMSDLATFGLLFETLAMRDLRVYAEALFGTVYHFKDKQGRECDAVVKIRGGKYGLVEVKLGGGALVDEGATALNNLEQLIDTGKSGMPAFKMVLTAVGDYAYRRPDGVVVCPIGCLRP